MVRRASLAHHGSARRTPCASILSGCEGPCELIQPENVSHFRGGPREIAQRFPGLSPGNAYTFRRIESAGGYLEHEIPRVGRSPGPWGSSSTTEPCSMCFSAIHWARIKKIVYGTTTEDVARLGFNELHISDGLLKKFGKSRVVLEKSFEIAECRRLLVD